MCFNTASPSQRIGETLPDGFFKGELNSKTGFVPSNFVQPLLDQAESGASGLSIQQNTWPRTFEAMSDYNPELQSPNENPEAELAFREGDLITITGPMDEVTCDT